MKVGIITFHRAMNYGAILQAYALQHAIEKLGHDSEIIDYRSQSIEESASPLRGFKKHSGFVTSTKQLVFRARKNFGFYQFFNKYIHLSEKVKTNEELAALSDKYDSIFTGSDQVWNLGCSGNDSTYFLEFLEDSSKKNSYAASFGQDTLYDNGTVDFNKVLSDYNAISVRERSGVSIVKDVANRDAEVVLDPTLLLTESEWKGVIAKRPIREKYIFVYFLRPPKELLKYVDLLAEKTGYKVVNAKTSLDFFKKNSPADFLAWIYYSEYFVTNSFHGTVFSLIFKKKFAVELENKFETNVRSKELLEMVNIERNISLNDVSLIDNEVDYSAVDNIISEKREKSIEFIKRALNKNGNM